MDPKNISHAAAEALKKAAYDPKKLALLHTGAAMLLSFAISLINFLITKSMDATTGLAQMGSRAVLGTVQSVLSMAGTFALPFWEVGFLYAVLRNLRFSDARPADLTEGFRRFGAVARLYILIFAIAMLLFYLCMQVATILISLTPFWETMLQDAKALMDNAAAAGQTALSPNDMLALLPSMLPVLVVIGILLIVIGIPIFYRFRLAFFALMDDATGARDALRRSGRVTRGSKRKLFKLDLHFWWYYAALLVTAVIAYGDVLLPALGVTLPLSADALFFLTYGIYLVLQTLLAWQFAAHVQTAYAVFYEEGKKAAAQQTPPQLPEA